MQHRLLTSKGFTLIELLVVIAIISLLSSIVLASLNSARAKGRNAQRNAEALQLRTAFKLAQMNTDPPNPAYAYPCLTTSCYGGWSAFAAEATTDAYLSPYINKPTDPADGSRPEGGFVLLTPANWPGNAPSFPAAYYVDYLLEPGGTCAGGSYYSSGVSYVQCLLRIDN